MGLKIIDKYIIKKFLGTYFFSIVLILSVAIIFDITEKSDDFYDSNAPLHAIIFDYYLNFVPYYMNMFSSLFVFIAVIFFTSKLAGNSEIIAMLAGGVSFKRLMVPYFISATIIFLLSFVLGGYVIPHSTKKMLDFEDVYVKKFRTDIATDIQMMVEPGTVLYIETYQKQENRGYHCMLEHFDGKQLKSCLTADRITWDSAHVWTMENYLQRDFDGMRESLKRGESLDTTINVVPSEFYITSEECEQMTTPELTAYIKRQEERGIGNVQAFETERHKRYASPLAAFIMTLIGVSLSSEKKRGGMGLNLGVGIALTAIYILFSTVSSSFAVNGVMSSFMAVWLPNFVFLAIGLFLYTKTPK